MPSTSKLVPVLALLVAAAVLHFAREVLIPLAAAILLSFLLAPAVRFLERLKLGRVASALIVVVLAFGVIGGLLAVAGNQAISLTAKLPDYRHNISKKIQAIRAPHGGDLGKAAEAIKDFEKEAAPSRPPLAVKETPATPIAALLDFVSPFAKPLAAALAVLIFTILMLVHRENMRERLIGLFGAGRINLTTQAMGEASSRVSRYLFMQLLVNAAFGIPFGIALYFIGVPNAMLWGLLATVLRFIPYAGVWIAVAMPAMLAFAISDDWSMVGWTLGVFFALEAVMVYAVEPWVYGRSAGLSPLAIITAALFWTWLWGPIGLLLATPLTVCVAVMGRYIPELGFLHVLLGVEPVLSPEARLYQRLIALDQEEATDLAEKYVEEHGLPALFDDVLIPALALVERDRHQGDIDEEAERFIFDTTRRMVEELEEREEKSEEKGSADENKSLETEKLKAPIPPRRRGAPICIVAAHDEADQVAGLILARLLPEGEFDARVLDFPALSSEALDQIASNGCQTVVISAIPPNASVQAGYLARRLRKRFPKLKILAGIWTTIENIDRTRERLKHAGVDEVVTRLPEAVERLRQYAVPANSAPKQQPKAKTPA